ncbi:MAG: T9SS type A sorting domain-containing protein [Chitinophagales bacterium]
MRKFSISLLTLCFVLCTTASYAGVLDIRFNNAELTPNEDGTSTYCVDVQIKSQDIGLEIGSATVFFDYNTDAIARPVFNSLNFNNENTCASTLAPYQNSFNYLEMGTKGEGNYAILLNVPNQGCPTVTDAEWVDVAQYCFDVIDPNQEVGLSINTKYTGFNTDANDGNQHAIGLVENIDEVTVTAIEETAASNGLNIFPSVTNDMITVDYSAQGNTKVSITVYDMVGRVLQNQEANLVAGAQKTQISLAAYGNGYYLVEVNDGENTISEKVLLMK